MKSQKKLIHLLILSVCVGFLPNVQAVVPPPDGGYAGFNTAEGQNALFNLTTGVANTAVGWFSLWSDTDGSYNTAVGAGTLLFSVGDQNTGFGTQNTAIGTAALLSNTTGFGNTATGVLALFSNTTGSTNTANGVGSLQSNTVGERNTAVGFHALANGNGFLNFNNTAIGFSALFSNTSGQSNTATGASALFNNMDGNSNTAVGLGALGANVSGSGNIAIGSGAGQNVTGNDNIDIGNAGVAGESNTIRIGDATQTATYIAGIGGVPVTGAAVLVNGVGQLGTMASSRRFKDEVQAMDSASEAILALQPVTFRYKKEIDPVAVPQFGLVAEEVEKVNPDLVTRDQDGRPYTVRYEAVNAMLLNEFLKEHRKVQELEAAVSRQRKDFETIIAELKKEMKRVASRFEEQDARIHKVSAQVQ